MRVKNFPFRVKVWSSSIGMFQSLILADRQAGDDRLETSLWYVSSDLASLLMSR
jgi:hypothetical protein